MATSISTSRSRTAGNGTAAAVPGLVQPRQRKVPWVVLGVLIVAGAALAFGVWSSALGERQTVVVAAREITAGTVIAAADLRTARLAVDGDVGFVAATRSGSLVGRLAAVTIPAGGLVHPGQVTDGSLLGPGEAVVGVSLAPGAVPTPNLRAGDRVDVVAVSDPARPAGGDDDGSGVIASAEVFAMVALDDASRAVVVSLSLPVGDAPAVADAAGAGRVRLVLLPAVSS